MYLSPVRRKGLYSSNSVTGSGCAPQSRMQWVESKVSHMCCTFFTTRKVCCTFSAVAFQLAVQEKVWLKFQFATGDRSCFIFLTKNGVCIKLLPGSFVVRMPHAHAASGRGGVLFCW